MQLNYQSFTTLLQNAAAAVQGACSQLIDLTVGSPLRAALEAFASGVLWLQVLIAQVYSMTRLATSVGPDVDSWCADFDFDRLPGNQATTICTFGRFSTGGTALVPVGGQVKTIDGTQTFTVTIDTTQPTWNAGQNGYLMATGVSSCTAPVQAVNVGTQANVQAGTIGLLASSMPNVDTVTNGSAVTNGLNAESDQAMKLRWQNYIQTRSKATNPAVASAIQGVQQGIFYAIQENQAVGGAYQPGNFVVEIDDGTGSPPSTLLTAVSVAIAPVRPIGSTWSVQAATDTVANVALIITTVPSTNKPNLIGPVGTAIAAYIEALPIGSTLYFNRIASIAYGVDPSITDVASVTINSGTTDIAPGATGVIRAGTVSVT